MPIFRGGTSRGSHVRAIWHVLTCLIDDIPEVPSDKRVRLRTLRAMLERAYAGELSDEVPVAQALEEEDGTPLHD